MMWIVMLVVFLLVMRYGPRDTAPAPTYYDGYAEHYVVSPPATTRTMVRRRPHMQRNFLMSQHECMCGGVETDEQRALNLEHDCKLEVWEI